MISGPTTSTCLPAKALIGGYYLHMIATPSVQTPWPSFRRCWKQLRKVRRCFSSRQLSECDAESAAQRRAGTTTTRPLAELANLQRRRDRNPTAQPANRQPPVQQRRGINENYARELMELHTLGVDGGYTQKDVQEVARCFTGWTIFQPRGSAAAANALMGGDAARRNAGVSSSMLAHTTMAKRLVLGHKIPAGRDERWPAGARHPRASSVDCEVHRHQTRPALCFRRAFDGVGRSSRSNVQPKPMETFVRL